MKIASAQVIRQAEQAAFAEGRTTSSELMDAVVARLCRELPFTPRRVVAYIGRGAVHAGERLSSHRLLEAGDFRGMVARMRMH